MYRALTWAVLESGVNPDDPAAVAALCTRVRILSGTDPQAPTIAVAIAGDAAVDVAEPIRGEQVTSAVSAVSAVPEVRARMVELQRNEAREAIQRGVGIVVEGRDITTVVLPDADVKVFITADPEVRAQRRALQDEERGESDVDVARTEAALRARDVKDSTRAASPLTKADDAVVVDTTHLTLDEVIDDVVAMITSAR